MYRSGRYAPEKRIAVAPEMGVFVPDISRVQSPSVGSHVVSMMGLQSLMALAIRSFAAVAKRFLAEANSCGKGSSDYEDLCIVSVARLGIAITQLPTRSTRRLPVHCTETSAKSGLREGLLMTTI